MLRADVNKVDVQPVDLSNELRQRIQSRLALAPVVIFFPILCELFQRREFYSLGAVWNWLLFGPARRRDSPAKIFQCFVRNLDFERSDCGRTGISYNCR